MHDWVLISVSMDWKSSRVAIHLKDRTSAIRKLTAENVRDLHVPHENNWGTSASVNAGSIENLAAGIQKLRMEMQSGDTIEIVAERFEISSQE